MKKSQHYEVKMFERWLIKSFKDIIIEAPINSMTPISVLNNGKEEFIFVAKVEHWIYEPLESQSINEKTKIGVKAYLEGASLIFGFDVEPDISLETEIPEDKIKSFLDVLVRQDIITIVILDHVTFNIAWITNTYPFWRVKNEFIPLFENFGIKF